MRRISMLLTVACSLAAQSDDGGKKDFHKDLTKQKFNLRASVRMPKQVIVTRARIRGRVRFPSFR